MSAITPSKAQSLADCPYRFHREREEPGDGSLDQQIGNDLHRFARDYARLCLESGTSAGPAEAVAAMIFSDVARIRSQGKPDDYVNSFIHCAQTLATGAFPMPAASDRFFLEHDLQLTRDATIPAGPEDKAPIAFSCRMDYAWQEAASRKKKRRAVMVDYKWTSERRQLGTGKGSKVPQVRETKMPKDRQLRWNLLALWFLWPECEEFVAGHYYFRTGDWCWTSRIKSEDIEAASADVWEEIITDWQKLREYEKSGKWPATPNRWCDWCQFGPVKGNDTCPHYRLMEAHAQAMIGVSITIPRETSVSRESRTSMSEHHLSPYCPTCGTIMLGSPSGEVQCPSGHYRRPQATVQCCECKALVPEAESDIGSGGTWVCLQCVSSRQNSLPASSALAGSSDSAGLRTDSMAHDTRKNTERIVGDQQMVEATASTPATNTPVSEAAAPAAPASDTVAPAIADAAAKRSMKVKWRAGATPSPWVKLLIFGKPGTRKTRSALKAFCRPGTIRLAVQDGEDGTRAYEREFYQQFYKMEDDTGKPIMDPDVIEAHIGNLPPGCDALLIDSFTTYCDEVANKWRRIYMMREINSNRHKVDYFVLSPKDYENPRNEIRNFLHKITQARHHVVCTAHPKEIWAPDGAGGMPQPTGEETFDSWKKASHYFDVVLRLYRDAAGDLWCEIDNDKDRILLFGGARKFKWHEDYLRIAIEARERGEQFIPDGAIMAPMQAAPSPRFRPAGTGPGTPVAPANTAASTAASLTPQSLTFEPISEATLHEIAAWKKKIGISQEAYLSALKRVSGRDDITSARQLSEEQAQELLYVPF